MINYRTQKILSNRKKGKLDIRYHPSVYTELGGRIMTERSYTVSRILWQIERKRRRTLIYRGRYYKFHYGYK